MAVPRSFRRFSGLLFLAALLLGSLPAVATAQTEDVPEEEPRRSITAEGMGVVEVAPDTVDISLGVVTQAESLEVAQNENAAQAQAVIDALTAAGIAQEDIATAGYVVYPIREYDQDGNLVGIQGYEVANTLTVTIRDISIVGQVLDAAVTAGANQVDSINFYVADTAAAASQARRQAIENARAKADEMAEAAGVIVVGVYSIDEISSPEPEPVRIAMEEADVAAAEGAASQVPVSPGQTEIVARVRVVFEIDQPLG